MTIFLTFWLVALAIGAAIVVFYIYPEGGTSRLRQKLWPLRDELFDGIRNGEFKDPEQPRRLLEMVEITIAVADDLRPVRMAFLMALRRNLPSEPDRKVFELSEADSADQPRLAGMQRRFISAAIRHLLYGGPSALLFAVVAVPTIVILTLLRDRPRDDGHFSGAVVDDVKEALRKEIAVEPTLRVLARTPRTPTGAAV